MSPSPHYPCLHHNTGYAPVIRKNFPMWLFTPSLHFMLSFHLGLSCLAFGGNSSLCQCFFDMFCLICCECLPRASIGGGRGDGIGIVPPPLFSSEKLRVISPDSTLISLFGVGGQHRNCPPHFSVQKNCESYRLTQHSSLLKVAT